MKSFRITLIFLLFISANLLFLSACSKDEESSSGGGGSSTPAEELTTTGETTTGETASTPELKTIDITGASSLTLINGKLYKVLDATTGTRSLNQIGGSGGLQEVEYKNEKGEVSSNGYTDEWGQPLSAVGVWNVDGDYVIVAFGWDTYNVSHCYLTRKSDGAVFSLTAVGCPSPQLNNFKNAKTVQKDAQNHIYYKNDKYDSGGQTSTVKQIDYSNPEQLTAFTYTPDTEIIDSFTVNSTGHLLYTASTADYSSSISRIRKANGGYYNLPNVWSFWVGLDSQLYYFDSSSYPYAVKRVSIDASYNVSATTYVLNSPYISSNYQNYKIELNNKIFFIPTGSYSYSKVIEDNGTGMREFSLPMSDIRKAAASDNYYYVSGLDNSSTNNSVLIKVNPTDDSVIQMYPPGTYDIYEMNVSASDELTFNALRMSDGVKVLGKIASDGTLSILDETLNTQVTVLERIN